MTSPTSKLTSFKDAKKIMMKTVKKNKTEFISLEDAENRILAQDIFSKTDIPEFNNAAVDGFGFINSIHKKKNLIWSVKQNRENLFLKKLKKIKP